MILAGVVVHLNAEPDAVRQALAAWPGVLRVEEPGTPRTLVLVMEDESESAIVRSVQDLVGLDGVLGVYPVYIHRYEEGDPTCKSPAASSSSRPLSSPDSPPRAACGDRRRPAGRRRRRSGQRS